MLSGLLSTLRDIVGPADYLAGAEIGPFVVGGRTPCAVVFPATVAEIARVVIAAATAGVPVVPWGGGTRMSLGAPPREGALVIGTRRLARVLEHEPGDLTATVEAGVTIVALQHALGARGQWVPLDPPLPDRATVGGVLATNTSGPRRHLRGGPRDLVLGVRVVGPDGALVRAGGKVVKNVAGYDLAKLHIGALGTLGLIVDATFKLRPRPEAERASWAVFDDVAAAAAAGAAILTSDLAPHALELLNSAAAAACAPVARLSVPPGAVLLVGFDGLPETVAWQTEEAEGVLRAAGAGAVQRLDDVAAGRALAAVRDLPFTARDPLAVATAGVLPAEVGAYMAEAAATLLPEEVRLLATAHGGEGILTLVLTGAGPECGPAAVKSLGRLRDQARARGGHLVVERVPLGVKAEVPAWDPPGPSVAIMRRIKAQLDPNGIMNPGRFVGAA